MRQLLNGSKRAEAAQKIADTGERAIKAAGGVSTALAAVALVVVARRA